LSFGYIGPRADEKRERKEREEGWLEGLIFIGYFVSLNNLRNPQPRFKTTIIKD